MIRWIKRAFASKPQYVQADDIDEQLKAWEAQREALRQAGFRFWLHHYPPMNVDILCRREGKPDTFVVRPADMHPAMNVGNLWWRPIAVLEDEPMRRLHQGCGGREGAV